MYYVVHKKSRTSAERNNRASPTKLLHGYFIVQIKDSGFRLYGQEWMSFRRKNTSVQFTGASGLWSDGGELYAADEA
jgi:hypothetical protein